MSLPLPRPRRFSTRSPFLAALAAAALAGGCGDGKGGVGPNGTRGIQVVAGSGVTDTIGAEPAQSLVVEVHDETGKVRSGLVVRFEPAGNSNPYYYDSNIYVGALDQRDFGFLVVDTTDSRGRASARVKFGGKVGAAGVRISVPDLGMVDTADYTVKPGAGVRVVAAPKDTALYAGRSFSLRGSVVDRFGNATAGSVSYSLVGTAVTLAGGTATGKSEGRAKIVTSLGGLTDTTYVSVLPEGVLAAIGPQGVVMFNTDGSALRQLATVTNGGLTTDWSPDGAEVAYDASYGGRVKVVNLAGSVRDANPSGTSAWELYPEFSPDGNSIFYSKEAWTLRRVRRDGTGDEPVPMSVAGGLAPSLSPDGTRLVYVVTGGGGQDALRFLTLATGEVTNPNIAGHSPSWSPTGDRIAYLDPQGYVLKVMNPDGTGVRQVGSADGSYAFGIDWSPDGKWIVAKNARIDRIELVNATTGVALPLGFTNGMSGPSWRP